MRARGGPVFGLLVGVPEPSVDMGTLIVLIFQLLNLVVFIKRLS